MVFYEHEGGLYVNLTNRCPVACRFCVKRGWRHRFRGQDLDLAGDEPDAGELIPGLEAELAGRPSCRELVFCGFGEPTLRLEEMNALGLHARRLDSGLKIRLNTIGLGSLAWRRDIVPELSLYLDAVSVSLNTTDPEQWVELHRPAPAYRERGFEAVRAFTERCAAAGLRTRVTAVEQPGVDLDAVRRYASSVAAEFLARPALA